MGAGAVHAERPAHPVLLRRALPPLRAWPRSVHRPAPARPARGEDARAAVSLWALLTGGNITRQHLQQPPDAGAGHGSSPAARAAALAMAAGWLLFTRLLVGLPGDPGMGVAVFRWAALLLGLGAAVLAAPETDPPRDVLRAGPVPRWRALVLRLAGRLAGARGGADPGPGGAAGRHRRLDRRRPGHRDAAGLRVGDRRRLPGRRQDVGPWRRRRRQGRRGRPGHGRAGLAGLVPDPAQQRSWPPALAVEPGLDGRAQPRAGRGGLGAGGSHRARVGVPRRRPTARPSPASQARARP
jgi:hypothetical protein